MNTLPIEGSDISAITPVNRVLHVAGVIKNPRQNISIKWEVDGASGSTECQAWQGQYEIECLNLAGYVIKSIEAH
jgi:hypothetical protein